MAAILDQLGLDQTFFVQMIIFAVLFLLLANIYFKPFMRLLHARHQRTVADREAAEKLMAQAEAKFEEYKTRLALEYANSRKEVEALLSEAKKEEAELLAHARSEAKKITQEAAESVNAQREQIKARLEADVEQLANTISETLLSKRG